MKLIQPLVVAVAAAERVIPNASATQAEKPATAPSKGRRLGLVALLAAVLGAVFFWLKPSTPETVEELQQQQGGSLPIEFRPVDEEEARRAEAQAQAEREAALQAQQTTQNSASVENAPQTSADTMPSANSEPMPATPAVETPTQGVGANAQQSVQQPAQQPQAVESVSPAQEMPVVKPVEPKPVAVQKPKTQGSVVYQPERKAPAKVKAMTADEFNAKKSKNAQMDQFVKNIEAGKSVPKTAPATKATESVATGAVSSKTLTVPKSTSLMQVFRNNNLNISDVNAMNKVNNIVSKLKENEKVTVRLDKNNRVVEMSIGSGGKFTRQADGSYKFK